MRRKIGLASRARFMLDDWFFSARELAWIVLLIGVSAFVGLILG